MKFNLKNTPTDGSAMSWEVWKKGFEKELRDKALDIEHKFQGKFEPMIPIKEILGE